jgi:type I restriction enzyme S subunit
MLHKVAFRQLLSDYIGGGWGTEACNDQYSVAASVIRGTDIPVTRIGIVTSVPERFHKASNYRSRALNAGDIIMEVSGGSKDQPVGRSMLVTERLLAKLRHRVIPASFCKRLVLNSKVADPAFASYILDWLYQTREITQWQVQSTGISNFNFEAFLDECEVPAPDLTTQTRIAAILSVHDDLIENNTRRIAILEEMARRIYEEWFVHFRFPGHEQVRMVESELGLIPEGWKVSTVDIVAEEIIDYRGKTPAKLGSEWVSEGILALSALNVKHGRLVNLEKSKLVSEGLYLYFLVTVSTA